MRIYMGGPMFTAADVAFNLQLAVRLRVLGFSVYCPNESEPINDKTRTDVTARKIYDFDIAELEAANVLLCQVSEDSGTNWEAGYFDCLSKHVDPSRYWGIVGVASDIRLRTPPNPACTGVENMAGYVNPLVVGGMQQSLGIYLDIDAAIDRLLEVRKAHETQ
ncbi:MAG: nucleoside 2-deoxyribosyltransferase [Thermomicrobiales bacterium]|nr:nucleoside 2-deoxyribosyltransferase [Thermomicrobiales bacterium]